MRADGAATRRRIGRVRAAQRTIAMADLAKAEDALNQIDRRRDMVDRLIDDTRVATPRLRGCDLAGQMRFAERMTEAKHILIAQWHSADRSKDTAVAAVRRADGNVEIARRMVDAAERVIDRDDRRRALERLSGQCQPVQRGTAR